MKSNLIVLLFLSTPSFAQIDFDIYTGTSYPFGKGHFSNSLSDNYYPGFNFGGSANYFVLEKFSVSPFAEYSNYFFRQYNSNSPGIPEVKFVSASGKSFQFYNMGFNIKFFPRLEPLPQGYFFTGLAWSIVNPGSIDVQWYDMNRGYFQSSEQVDDKNYLAQTFGLGVRILKFSSLQLMLEGLIRTNYSDRFLGYVNVGIYL